MGFATDPSSAPVPVGSWPGALDLGPLGTADDETMLADAAAVASESGVTLRLGTTVTGVESLDSGAGEWRVHADTGGDEEFDLVWSLAEQ